jgi:putative ABC transport system permease protein
MIGRFMFKNYFKIALRNIYRQKGYSIINISGLSIGIACSILIMLWVQNELSYDKFHKKAGQIHQVYLTIKIDKKAETVEKTSAPLAVDLKNEFPEIINSTRLCYLGEKLLRFKESVFVENNGACVDPSYLQIFTYPLIKGDPNKVLNDPHSIILTENFAKKYFAREEPLGKIITMDNKTDFVVTGVMQNIPSNSNRKFDFLIPFNYLKETGKNINGYNNTEFYTYVLIKKDISYQQVSNKIYTTFLKASNESGVEKHYYLVPLTETHLQKDFSGRYFSLFALPILAFLILIIACINFINLSTARLVYRTKEIGVRKVIGATRGQLFKQFIGESLLITFIATLFALFFVELFLPSVNILSGKQLSFAWSDSNFILGLTGIIIFTAIAAGSYPAFILSSFQPVKVFRETLSYGKKAGRFRKILVGVQFTFAIIFLVITTVTYLQSKYMKNADLGFSKENIMYVSLKGGIEKKYEIVKQKLLQSPDINNVTSSDHLPQIINSGTLDWGTKENKNLLAWKTNVDFDYLKTFDMKMAQGRFYSKDFPSDKSDAIVIDENAVKLLGWENPVGKRFFYEGQYYTIIGIVKSFQCFPMSFGKAGLILKLNPESNKYMFVKINSKDPKRISNTVSFIKNTCRNYGFDYPLEYNFLDDYLFQDIDQAKFGEIIEQLMRYFTFLGIFIACLGLLGLSSYITERRNKEFGIRKILGATNVNIVKEISREFIQTIIAANLIAMPLSYFMINGYLQMYAYRVSLSIWIFLTTGFFIVALGLFTICFQAIKAAVAKPVDSLRYE